MVLCLAMSHPSIGKPARNPCKRSAAQHPATMKVAGTSVELVSTVLIEAMTVIKAMTV